ncbi:hypothetical protein I3843_15G002400 [Carya illinoinensis]|uniref:Uncharacterized protein n=1 Tax=Carya illinoinensis TaxID=32201 RepID=A0A8T1N648_CARIL|nr:transcription factor TCP12 [Carya illinoinensis]KAG6625785.1 hypothetical protein CIPAW_15G002900 [Carya illinoinensis]KAG6673675.1 hypothetical protein I3842_15G002700 [Carya illinoinensis]KAG6673676.1 hypothetical protein I3842_15G002700 [Carya illinoinensis]KAG6673677.1 hypothetical protein I3842_15G002700 [Carya illinoinensis]KAG7942747.1 hypothetical protein I3843_15G002400 [Carya illinoinensis]
MFPCSSDHNPFTYTCQSILEIKPFANDEKTSSGQEEHPSSYTHLSATFLEDDELFLSHFLSQQKLFFGSTSQAETENSVAASDKATNDKKEASGDTVAEQIPSEKPLPNKKSRGGSKQTLPRKRTGKKDRHSKICTAQGPRDRRMRLSLQIARKFFDLQDMLGFDKASKTIEWLFSKSKTAIKELTESISQVKQSCSNGTKNVSVTSDIEEISENVEIVGDDGDQGGFGADVESFNPMARETTNRKSSIVARDSRDKARARARERTRNKMMIRGLGVSKQMSEGENPNNLGRLCSSIPLEEAGEESCFRRQERKSSLDLMADQVEEPINHLLEHQIDYSVSINERFLGVVGAPRSSLILNHSRGVAASSGGNTTDEFPGFPVNWINNDNANMQTSMKPSTVHERDNQRCG